MNIIKEFLYVLKEARHFKFSYFFLFFQLVYFSGLVRQFGSDEFLIGNIILTFGLSIFEKRITSQDLKLLIYALGIFLSINIIPTLLHGISVKLFLGYFGRITLGILILIYYKERFFDTFEKLVFVLAIISIPLFALQIIHIEIFKVFQPISDAVLSQSRLSPSQRFDINISHQYAFFFLVNQWGVFRNSGFMWEPAAYGAVLSWAILINMFSNRFTLNPRLTILLLAAITTFSIGTYLYLTLFTIIFVSKNFGNRNAFLLIMSILVVVIVSSRFEFVQYNIDMISGKIESEQINAQHIQANQSPENVSRIGGFLGNIKPILFEPFGFGTRYNVEKEHNLYSSPNGLVTLLRNWGVFSIIIILASTIKLLKGLRKTYKVMVNPIQVTLFIMILILTIAGNPFYNQPLFYSILLGGFILRN